MPSGDRVREFVLRRYSSPETLGVDLPHWEESALDARALTPMQTRAWIVACAEAFTGDEALDVVVLEDGEGIAAVAPLVRGRAFPAANRLLGVRELSEPTDLLFRDEAALAELLTTLATGSTPLRLDRVPSGSSSLTTVRKSFRSRAIVVRRPETSHPVIALPAGKPVEQLLSSSLRSDLRRARRKADALGPVSFEVHAPRTAAEFLPLYQQKVEVEAAGWKGRHGTALAMNAKQRDFFRRYGVLASEAGLLRLAVMRIGGVVTAMQYAVEWHGALWLLKIGHDETYAKCSPGMLLMEHTLRYALERGLHSYEFLGSAEAWTRRWPTTEKSTDRVAIYPFGARGIYSLGRDSFRALAPRLAALGEGEGRASANVPEAPAAGSLAPRLADELVG